MKTLLNPFCFRFLAVLLCVCSLSAEALLAQSVTFRSSWVEFDKEENGELGFCIHYDFTVNDMKNEKIKMVAFVYTSENEWAKSYREGYKTAGGNVCTWVTRTPSYDSSRWEDLTLFIPYDAMPLAKPGVTYSYTMAVRKMDETTIKQDNLHEFDWTSHSPSAQIEKVWLEHNVSKNDERGIYIHAKVTVDNNKGKSTNFTCFILDENDKYLPSERSGYKSTSGRLCTFEDSKPSYDSSLWEDYKLFLPYSLLPQNLGTAKYHFALQIRDVARDYAVMAKSENKYFDYTISKKDSPKETPVLEWLSGTDSNSASYVVQVGVNSKSEVSATSVKVNGSEFRGMQTVQGNGYALTINQTVTLNPGENTIVVTATNADGTTTQKKTVKYNKAAPAVTGNGSRVALVIGNAKYERSPLSNPVNDARDISASLTKLGFDVVTVVNGTRRQMEEAIIDLGKRSDAGSVALFYYSGHGIQNNGHNYLIPIGANIASAADLEYECTDVNRVLSNLEEAQCTMNIVVLDACRDDPFSKSWARSASSQGLTGINAPFGTLIAYATAPGSVAIDGAGRHSPFSQAFLNTLSVPGLSLFDFFQQIQQSVQQETGGKQIPWLASSFLGQFYFNPEQ